MLVRRVSSKQARDNFAEILGVVYYTKEPVVVERNGKPYAVMISPEQYERIEKERESAWAAVRRVQEANADKDPDEVYRDVTEVVEQARQERYERAKSGHRSR